MVRRDKSVGGRTPVLGGEAVVGDSSDYLKAEVMCPQGIRVGKLKEARWQNPK